MTNEQTTLHLRVAGSDQSLELRPQRATVAGYTGRDEQAVAEHIAELAAIGVPEPATVPAFYELDPALLTTAGVVPVAGSATSGEVEPVLIRHRDSYYLTVGSDHTDRDLERQEIAASKAACPKPLADTVVALGTDLSQLDWDAISASSYVDDVAYQQGQLAGLRRPEDLLTRLAEAVSQHDGQDLVVFGGTLPLLTGEFVHGTQWLMRLDLADGTTLTHSYETKQRSA